MMKMDGRGKAECQNWEKRDKIDIIGIDLSHKKTKNATVLISYNLMNQKLGSSITKREMQSSIEREHFSLDYRAIRPSALFETRRKAALRGEGFAWVPDLGSFLKLLEAGVSPYLGFIPSLSIFSMFELNEAVRGRLIGPKTWDRIFGNFFRNFLQSVTVGAVMGC